MEHLEFIDRNHFEFEYHRKWAKGKLFNFIDFCWETDFNILLRQHPEGFSDVLFPNIGYTYLINLGTPFVMQLEKASFEVKSNGFLPRHNYITCHHSKGNQLFGIKFKVCPIIFQKNIDFSEYKEYIFPLAYLIEGSVVNEVKAAASFKDRVEIVFGYYNNLIDKYAGTLQYVNIVTEILKECTDKNNYNISIESLAEEHNVSKRTLQRYFEATTSFSSKQALQTIRIRKAVTDLTTNPSAFKLTDYGYYDYSHFFKHLKQFVGAKHFSKFQAFYNKRKGIVL